MLFSVTNSTHALARQIIAEMDEESQKLGATLILADSQERGEGRGDRGWESPPGGLYMSWLRSGIKAETIAQLPMLAAAAAHHALSDLGISDLRIKWPNDILIGDRKIAGILTEISTEMDLVDWVVVGLGLNVNTPAHRMPPEIRDIATSVRIQKGRPVSRVGLLCALLESFEACYEQLKAEGFGPIMEQWRQMTDIIGQRIHVDVMDTRHIGTVAAVDDDGVLILQDDQGQVHRIFSGDVTRVRPNG